MYSQTYGNISFDKVIEILLKYINDFPDYEYKITVGSDSQNNQFGTKMVTVIAICRVGKGGIFFYDINNHKRITNLSYKIHKETEYSLNVATKLAEELIKNNILQEIEIHTDIGKNGETSKLVSEIIGWIKSSGYNFKIKPDSYTSSTIVNKISK